MGNAESFTPQLLQITDEIKEVLSEFSEIYAAVLLGSCSRGEETYFISEDGKKTLLSDVEISLIIEKNCNIETVNKRLSELNCKLQKKIDLPIFELSWGFVKKNRLPTMDRRFIVFETYAAGKLLYGNEGVFSLFPKFSVKNLNYSELNSIINHRLAHVLYNWQKLDEKKKKYCLARNTLDITTVVLPYMGYLIPTYHKRNVIFTQLNLEQYFGEGINERLKLYLDMKMDYLHQAYDLLELVDMKNTFISDMKALYAFVQHHRNGYAFCNDKRRIISSLMRMDIKRVCWEFHRADYEESAFNYMIGIIDNIEYSSDVVDEIKNRMLKIYGCL